MKTKYFMWTNRVISLFFLDREEDLFIKAYQTHDINKLCDAAVLELDEDGLHPKSRWSHVRCEIDLIAQCERMDHDDKYFALTDKELKQTGKDNEQ